MADNGAASAVDERPAPGQAAGLLALRVTQAADLQIIRPLVEEYHRESRYGHIPFSEHKLQRLVTRAINSPDTMLGAYVRYRNRAVGIVHANAGDYYLARADAWSRRYAYTWLRLFGGPHWRPASC
jgi:hypothetical protein